MPDGEVVVGGGDGWCSVVKERERKGKSLDAPERAGQPAATKGPSFLRRRREGRRTRLCAC